VIKLDVKKVFLQSRLPLPWPKLTRMLTPDLFTVYLLVKIG